MFTICNDPMHETIYFEKYCEKTMEIHPCPLCHLHRMAEENEKEIVDLKGRILELEKENQVLKENKEKSRKEAYGKGYRYGYADSYTADEDEEDD